MNPGPRRGGASRWLAAALLLCLATPAPAHRLDECLQATTLAVEKRRIVIRLRLTPGVDVLAKIMTDIDSNGDGVISEAEQLDYLERVRSDLSLTIDGVAQRLRAVGSTFPTVESMGEGLGEIVLEFQAEVPVGRPGHKLAFANRHRRDLSVYLVNCLVPSDPALHIVAQSRSHDQSLFQLEYTDETNASGGRQASEPR